MKTALVHDDLMQSGGAERVVASLSELYSDAPLYVAMYDQRASLPYFRKVDVRTSFLQRWPLLRNRRFHKLALSYFPAAFEQFDFSGYDVVLSSSSRFAKGVITGPETCHICYCHTPARFAWRQHDYFGRNRYSKLVSPLIRGMLSDLRGWDVQSALRVDYFIANSHNVARRIGKHYRREVAAVIYPPVETDKFQPVGVEDIGDHFLVVSRLVGYKRVDLAIHACNRLGVPLRIIGSGPELNALRRIAGPNTVFLGNVSDEHRAHEYARCRALIFAGEEDFGLTPLEAMASGRPVAAYAAGGALETVTQGETGVFFGEQTVESLCEALASISSIRFEPRGLRENALRFDTKVFRDRIRRFIDFAVEDYRQMFGSHQGDKMNERLRLASLGSSRIIRYQESQPREKETPLELQLSRSSGSPVQD